MIFAGCDVGSLTVKAVLMDEERIIASEIIRIAGTADESARTVMRLALQKAGLESEAITSCCSTGYGRMAVPFAGINRSEISCHALGAFWQNNSIRTLIDIGGQD